MSYVFETKMTIHEDGIKVERKPLDRVEERDDKEVVYKGVNTSYADYFKEIGTK
ncbi:hypothetical protein ACKXGF_07410 [Alkalibacillus sp. S2W]|uniref:hypothetical protein n=1 Tax=Alkalibacillus sp. S2W TaxID=3386553 RepID=UPI00398D5A98